MSHDFHSKEAHRPKRRFGQNFLTVPYYAERIALSVPEGGSVCEIGPGKGALSVHLKKRFPEFTCVEMDRDVIPILTETLGDGPHKIINTNFLEFDINTLPQPVHFAGNLPYNVAAFIMKKALLSGGASVTFMVQREVAERIVSTTSCGEYGYLSVFCQYFGTPKILFTVPPGAFFPKPKVDSSVFQIMVDPVRAARLPKESLEGFFRFVSDGFSQRRKMVAKVITGAYNQEREKIDAMLIENNIPVNSRAEDLSVSAWIDWYRTFSAAQQV